MKKAERLAVIIASKNRSVDIDRTLSSLALQSVLADDVLVIDQSDLPYDLTKYPAVRHVHDTSISSLAAARNRGVALVDSPRVLFLDDDVELFPSTIGALQAAFDTFPDTVGFQCDDVEHHELGRLSPFLEFVFAHGFFSRRRSKRGSVVEVAALEGYGMAYRSTVFDHERFDEELSGYSFGEDWDFAKRAARYGRLIVAPGAELHHYRSKANRNSARNICRMRWVNYNYFFKKNVPHPTPIDMLLNGWWKVGETYRWLREGLGFPSDSKARERDE